MPAEMEIQNKLKETFGEAVGDFKIPRERRMFLGVSLSQVKPVIAYLKDNFGLTHITTITGIDTGSSIEIIYHLLCQQVALSLKTRVPKSNPVIETITALLPGAILYERELQEMLGVIVKDHPDPRRLVLPENWEEGVYPLRKDYQIEKDKAV